MNISRFCEFYEKLLTHVQSLERIGKLNIIKRYVRNTLDKLPDLVRLDSELKGRNFPKLIDALR